jgi:outer membrane murein-binding lipoprotein Lpp
MKALLKPFLGAAIVAMALLAGCSTDREKLLIGTWETREGSASVEAPKALENVDTPGGLSSAMATLAHTELALKDDKTFAVSGTMQAQGSWTFDKESGALTLTPAGGAPVAAHLSDANQQLSLPNPTGAGKEIVLQKKEN